MGSTSLRWGWILAFSCIAAGCDGGQPGGNPPSPVQAAAPQSAVPAAATQDRTQPAAPVQEEEAAAVTRPQVGVEGVSVEGTARAGYAAEQPAAASSVPGAARRAPAGPR